MIPVLSIEAWRNPWGWDWNSWRRIGEIDRATLDTLTTNRKVLRWMRDEGYLTPWSKGRVTVEDDQYNLVILDKNTREPLFAIEYGAKEES